MWPRLEELAIPRSLESERYFFPSPALRFLRFMVGRGGPSYIYDVQIYVERQKRLLSGIEPKLLGVLMTLDGNDLRGQPPNNIALTVTKVKKRGNPEIAMEITKSGEFFRSKFQRQFSKVSVFEEDPKSWIDAFI
ncbi:hypothetical protein TWF696_006834 [Orbilia brochopaga]|uniref:Uncharacterized protein n=1 Tax=Orbilia brochopaga TaxID=3140254 RepID=A0AAV9UPX5_9PEZI